MIIDTTAHLTYCTNIHPGESWEEVFNSLKQYTLKIRRLVQHHEKPFGIGLRLSQKSAQELLAKDHLQVFKKWLNQHQLYVFTLNGFPYGEFHATVIKDQVHTPDWTTIERLQYTKNLMKILEYLLPSNLDGGVSTSPISYKHWFLNQDQKHQAKLKACEHFTDIVLQLIEIKNTSGKTLHLDLEPEPDGFLENTEEVIEFYENYLFKYGAKIISNTINCSLNEAVVYIKNHIQICYDVCHFSLAYEAPKFVLNQLTQHGIKIGKIQISAALKCKGTEHLNDKIKSLSQFDEPTYLHQAVIQTNDNQLKHFPDLSLALKEMVANDFKEIRTHFHVPVFLATYHVLQSTQDDIITMLKLWKENKFCNHLEVETYTWDVLPQDLKTDLAQSIARELNWVKTIIE